MKWFVLALVVIPATTSARECSLLQECRENECCIDNQCQKLGSKGSLCDPIDEKTRDHTTFCPCRDGLTCEKKSIKTKRGLRSLRPKCVSRREENEETKDPEAE